MYEVETVEVEGPFASQTCDVVRMPRDRFMEIVNEVLAESELPNVERAKLREVASGMRRFPFATWIQPTRGCGCLIGEYAVRYVNTDRSALVDELRDDNDVNALLGVEFADVGYAVDAELFEEVRNASNHGVRVILIEDAEEGGTC